MSEQEKAEMKFSRQLASLLSQYFTNNISLDDLWKGLKKHKDEGRAYILKDAQLKILESLRLSNNNTDTEKLYRGLLAAESLKDNGNYTELEHDLKSIDDLRQQYKEGRNKAYDKIKAEVEKQVRLVVQQMESKIAGKGGTIDIKTSIEASVNSSPQWKSFISEHENNYNRLYKGRIVKLREKLDI